MQRSHCLNLFSGVAFLALAVLAQNAFAQWTYRIAPDPIIRNISVFPNVPSAGTNTLIVSTITDEIGRAHV